MLGKSSSPLLAKAEAALVAKIPPALRGAFQKVLSAGMAILYAPDLQAKLKQKLATTDPVQSASQGCVTLAGELWKQSKYSIPKPLMVPALLSFAFEYLDLAAKAGKVQITPDVIAQVTQLATQNYLKATGANVPGAQPQGAAAPAPVQPPAGGIVGGAMQGAQ